MEEKISACVFVFALILTGLVNVEVSHSSSGDLINLGIAYPIQVVWQYSDTGKLVANKSTAIRVWIESTFSERVLVEINVTYNFGTEWYLEMGRGGNGVPIDPGYNTVYVPNGPAEPGDPNGWGDNPPTTLLWTRVGIDDKIEVVVDPLNKVHEEDETNNRCTFEPVEVVKAKSLKILVVPINGTNPRTYNFISGWDAALNWGMDFLRNVFPVADDGVSVTIGECVTVDFGTNEPTRDLLYQSCIHGLSEEARILGYDRVVAVVPDPYLDVSGTAIGMLREPEDRLPVVLSGGRLNLYQLLYRTPRLTEGSFEWVFRVERSSLVAHEIGHTFYLWHPHDIGPPVYEDYRWWVKARSYGEKVGTLMRYGGEYHWIDVGRYNSDPKTWIDLSGYDTEVDGTWQWNLFDQFKMPDIRVPVLVMGGSIFLNGTVRLDENWHRMPEGKPDLLSQAGAPQKGDYGIFMLDDKRHVISQLNFNASFTYLVDLNGTLTKAETDVVPFLFSIPDVEGARFVQIRNADGEILQEREITTNSPVVNIDFPNGGESLNIGGNYTISWNAYDPDGDELSYLISYSKNEGETWIPLASNLKTTSYIWDTSSLTFGDKYLIRVIATDGVNTGEDVSNNTFTMVDLIPPVISNVTQDPQPEAVQPNQNVTVHANITDINSGVKNAYLLYRYSENNGVSWSPWINETMNHTMGDTFIGNIPSLPFGTLVQYKIFATDNSNNTAINDNMGQYYVYTVVSEFPSIITLPILMVFTMITVALAKKKIVKRKT